MAANRRASNIAFIVAILPPSTRYHSATRECRRAYWSRDRTRRTHRLRLRTPSYIHPLDEALEPLQRLHQCFGAVERTDRAAKGQVVMKELSRSDKIAAAHRLLEGCNDLACVGHRSNILTATTAFADMTTRRP